MHKKNNFLYVLITEMGLDNFHYVYTIMQLSVQILVHGSVKCRASVQKFLCINLNLQILVFCRYLQY